MTGGRIQRLAPWLGGTTFMATYGDGLADIDLRALIAYHRAHGKLATVTAVRPPPDSGAWCCARGGCEEFSEKSQAESGWINGRLLRVRARVLRYLDGDDCILERGPLERLAAEGQLMAFRTTASGSRWIPSVEGDSWRPNGASGRASWRICE